MELIRDKMEGAPGRAVNATPALTNNPIKWRIAAVALPTVSHIAFDLPSHQKRLLSRVEAWALARSARLKLAREMTALRCEYYERPEFEVGDSGQPVCRFSDGPTPEWCEPCQQRQALFQGEFSILRKIETEHFRLLCAMAERRAKTVLSHQECA